MEGQGVASSSQTEKVACTGRCCNSSNKQRETVRMFVPVYEKTGTDRSGPVLEQTA